MITVIDYGAGNLRSVCNALKVIGAEFSITSERAGIARASAILLPGVGHFAQIMQALKAADMLEPLRDRLQAGTPYLGICLGMQALYETSEEAPDTPGLSLLPGSVRRFPRNLPQPRLNPTEPRPDPTEPRLKSAAADEKERFLYRTEPTAPPTEPRPESAATEEKERFLGAHLAPATGGNPCPTLRVPHMGWTAVEALPSAQIAAPGMFYFAHSYYVPAGCEGGAAIAHHGFPFIAAVERGNLAGCQFHPEKSGPAGLEFLKRWAAKCRPSA